jgi:hypothetical protein
MPIVRITTPREVTWDVYDKVQARIEQRGTPPGLITHTAVDNNGLPKFVDIWESDEHAAAFGEHWIGPIIAEIAPDVAGPPEPDQVEVYEVRHMTRG